MKTTLMLCLVCAVAFGAARAVAYDNLSGTACHALMFDDQSTWIGYSQEGRLLNLGWTALWVVCPVNFTAGRTGAVTVYVDGDFIPMTTSSTIACTLFSYNYDGTFLGSTFYSRTGSGSRWELTLSLPSGQAPTYAYLSVLCSMGPGSEILGVTAGGY